MDKDGTEYLTFQNNMEPEMLVYNMKKQTYVRTISFDREGANGIGWFGGYYIKSWDEIYLPEMMRPEINIVNSDGRLLRAISYAETVQGKQMGRTKFSIIILNDQFEVIGETLFPENVYVSTQYFIRKEGLYIGTSFPKNPNFDENTLSFQRIELIKL